MVNENMHSFDIEFVFQVEDAPEVSVPRVQKAIEWVLRSNNAPSHSAMTVVLTGNDEVQVLNRDFRDVDAPTDVLSFPSDVDLGSEVADEAEAYLGDLVLAFPYISGQAEREGHSVEDEVLLAVIHGTLHLLGYDHDSVENQTMMWEKQSAALAAMDVPIVVPEFSFEDDEY